MRLVFFLLIFTTAIPILSAAQAIGLSLSELNTKGALPELLAFIRPIQPTDFEFINHPVQALASDCASGVAVAPHIKPILEDACILIPAWNHLQKLTSALNDPNQSSIYFSSVIPTPHLDQLHAGTWRKNLSSQSGKHSFSFAAEVMLTKIIIYKSLLAYADYTVFVSNNPSNTAKTYIIPKIIQNLEGRTIIGGLFERFKSQKCLPKQSLANTSADLCFVEKMRIAAVLSDLYKENRKDIENAVRLASILDQEGNKSSLRQMALLNPLNATINLAKSSSDRVANMWSDLQKNRSKWIELLEQDIKNLTQFQMSLGNQDQISAYISLSALLATSDLLQASKQIESFARQVNQQAPEILSVEAYKALKNSSKKEITNLSSKLSLFIEDQELEMRN